jgi:hypothetical protein
MNFFLYFYPLYHIFFEDLDVKVSQILGIGFPIWKESEVVTKYCRASNSEGESSIPDFLEFGIWAFGLNNGGKSGIFHLWCCFLFPITAGGTSEVFTPSILSWQPIS